MEKSHKARGVILLLITSFIWGIAFVAQSVGMDHVEPFTFIAVRNYIACMFLIPCIAFLDKVQGYKPSIWGRAKTFEQRRTLLVGSVIIGLLLTVAGGLQQVGILFTTVGKTGFITTLYIIIVPILGLFLGKRISFQVGIAVLLAVVGMYLLCITESFTLNRGDFIVLLCAIGFSVHILFIEKFAPRTDNVRLAWIQFFICAVISTVIMFIFEKPTWHNIRSAAVPILFAGVLSSGIGYTFQILGQKYLSATVSSLIFSAESVFAVLAGWLILSEVMTIREIAGCTIMLLAIVLAQIPSVKRLKRKY